MADDTTITIGGNTLSGWTEERITRRIEGCPNDFDLALTERYPGEADAFVIQGGDPCTVSIGDDVVLTGYVDRYARSYSAGDHKVSVSGRGKTQDLVDCSAEWPTGQISGANVLEIATKLAKPYGITVTCLGDPGPAIPQFNLTLGESAYDIIERICRYAGLLAYEGTDGNLILANTQSTQAASGFTEGVNVQAAHVLSAMDQRFSAYVCFLMSMDVLEDSGQGGNQFASVPDINVPRHRLTYLIAEAGGGGQDICAKRAKWEAARRWGRGYSAQIIGDSWRDSAGALFAPNTQVPISLPNLKLDGVTWTIGEITYRRGMDGTTVEATCMNPSAFTPEPILLQPTFMDVNTSPTTPAT
jgi:prophage tail gpP-like protein